MIEQLAQRSRAALVSWIGLVSRLAWPVVLVFGLLTGLAGSYTARTFTVNTDTRDMISSEVEFRQNDNAFDAAFPQFEDLIVAVIEGPTPEDAEAAADRLAEALVAQPELFTHLRRPGAEDFFRENAFLFQSPDALSELADRLAAAEPLLGALSQDMSLRGLLEVLSQALEPAAKAEDPAPLPRVLDAIAEQAEAAPDGGPGALSWRSLLAPDSAPVAARSFLTTQPVLDHASLKPAEKAVTALRHQAAAVGIGAEQGLRMRLTGPAALDHEEFESVEVGASAAGVISLCAVSILLILGLRSVSLVCATILTLLVGLTWTAAFAMLAIGHLNIISVAFAVLFVGLGVDFGIHFTLRASEAAGEGLAKRQALERAAGGVGGALTLSALCAAAGFFAFLPTDYKGLAELGLISGTGMFIALFTNLTLLPALLRLLPLTPSQAVPAEAAKANPVEVLIRKQGRLIVVIAVLLALAGVAAAPFARFDFNPLNLKDPDSESVELLMELTSDPDSSPHQIDILAADLSEAEAIAEKVADLPEVSYALTLQGFVPAEQDVKLEILDEMALFLGPVLTPGQGRPAPTAEERAAELKEFQRKLASVIAAGAGDPALAAALQRLSDALAALTDLPGYGPDLLLRFEDRLLRHLPRALADLGTALSSQGVALADLPQELRRDWLAEDGRARIEVKPTGGVADNAELRRFAEAVLAVEPRASGAPIVITEAGKAVVRAFFEASGLAFVLILVLLALVLRRARDVALVLTPLGLAAAITTAATVALDLPFNFANVIVLPLLLGLGVASGIHLVMRHRHEPDRLSLLRTSTSRAVLFSALTTIASFGSLMAAGHPGMTSMGELLTVAISSTLVCTLVVLPSLMGGWRGT